MGIEVVEEHMVYRKAEGVLSLPPKHEIYQLCLSEGKSIVLSRLKNHFSVAAKLGALFDLNALRRTIVELEDLSEDQILECLTHPKTISVYRIAAPPTPKEEKALTERRRLERKRDVQEWLDRSMPEHEGYDGEFQDEDKTLEAQFDDGVTCETI